MKGVIEMPKKVAKAYAINDAKILYVSLVDKAANKKSFLITKADDGKAQFQTYGRIVKAETDSGAHYVTGIVYEPMTEDTQGNYMTEAEIEKAAHWFAKNGNGVDLQHDFEPLEGACVVESSVAKADYEIDGEPVKKGTWLMTMEITNQDIFDSITKGDITGFSMGGSGIYSDQDVNISDPENPVVVEKSKKGILKQLAGLFGMDVIEKGKVKDDYKRSSVRDNFWTAFYCLSDYLLDTYNPATGQWEIQTDEAVVREALADFNEIITELLAQAEPVTKCLNESQVTKAGKAMSSANVTTLQSIHDSLGEFLQKFVDEEEIEVTKAELETTVAEAVAKAMAAQTPAQNAQSGAPAASGSEGGQITADGVQKAAGAGNEAVPGITQADVDTMVAKAIEKATQPKAVTPEEVSDMIEKAVAKAMEPVMRSAGLPSNLNNEVQKGDKDEHHYLEGIL